MIRNKFLVVAALGVITLTAAITYEQISKDQIGQSSDKSDSDQRDSSQKGLFVSADSGVHYTPEELAEIALVDQREAERKLNRRHVAYLKPVDYETTSKFGERPEKIRGVELQRLYYDVNGNLILTESLQQLIEHFMLASDAEGLEQAIARVYEYIELTLPESAAEQASDVVSRYLDYKANMDQVPDISNIYETDKAALIDKMEVAFDLRKQVRRDYLGEEVASAFFEDQERFDDYAIERARIRIDETLSYWEKDAALAKAEESLPDKVYQRVKKTREKSNLEQRISELKEQGASDIEIHEARVAFYGADTAERIAYYEEKDDEWVRRMNTWVAERKNIEQNPYLSQTEKQHTIQNLLDAQFTQQEQTKLSVQELRNQLELVLDNKS